MKAFFDKHQWLYRAIRTFLQTAVGVIAAAVATANGVVEDLDMQALIVLAVSTGLAAVMNISSGKTE